MTEKGDRWLLVLLNTVIILASETVGGGRFFYETGLIQAFAFLFIVLAIVRIIKARGMLHDPALAKMVKACLLALLVFTESHVFAFATRAWGLSAEAVRVSVINFYVAGLLLIIIGAQFVLKVRSDKRSSAIIIASVFCLLFLFALTIVFALDDSLVRLDVGGPATFLYGALVLLVALFGAVTMFEARRAMSVFRRFWDDMLAGGALIGLAAMAAVFQSSLRSSGLPDNQIVYAGLFAFYAAASLMFLAFGTIGHMGGIYADLAAEEAKPATGERA